MILKNLSNEELHSKTKYIAEKERLATIDVLWHLRENARRMLFAQLGYRDLKEYCVKELKYSEGSAWRRISAMKLLVDTPEIEEKIQSGELNLTQICMAQSHFREVKATTESRKEVLASLENQSLKSTERLLAELRPETLNFKAEVLEKALRGRKLEVTLILDEETQTKLEEIQILMGRSYSKLELFKMMTDETLKRLKKPKRKAQPLRRRPATKSRSIAKSVSREIRERDKHQCQYRDLVSGRQCEARLGLQIEHIIPFGKGGSNESSNLELLCAAHNRLRAVEQYGLGKMKSYVPSLQ